MTQEIIRLYKNYDYIINYYYRQSDIFTKKLIDFYKNFVFRIENDDKINDRKALELDEIVYKYLKNKNYREQFRASIIELNIKNIIEFNDIYEDELMKKFENTLWI